MVYCTVYTVHYSVYQEKLWMSSNNSVTNNFLAHNFEQLADSLDHFWWQILTTWTNPPARGPFEARIASLPDGFKVFFMARPLRRGGGKGRAT